MGFALRLAKVKKSEIDTAGARRGEILDLTEHLDRKPANLSGGQRQRVAMGRAIVRDPQAFLMDEPLSNLDAKLRVQMRIEVARLQQRLGTTTVYVTHDQTEAMTLGDRVAVMRDGLVQQVDAPQRLYEDPANLFVAGFIGSPPMNLVPARVSADTYRAAVRRSPAPRRAQGPAESRPGDGGCDRRDSPGGVRRLRDRWRARGTSALHHQDRRRRGDGAGGVRILRRAVSFGAPDRPAGPVERRDESVLGGRGNVRQVVARLPVTSRVAAGQEATLTVRPGRSEAVRSSHGRQPAAARARSGRPQRTASIPARVRSQQDAPRRHRWAALLKARRDAGPGKRPRRDCGDRSGREGRTPARGAARLAGRDARREHRAGCRLHAGAKPACHASRSPSGPWMRPRRSAERGGSTGCSSEPGQSSRPSRRVRRLRRARRSPSHRD